MNIVEVCEILDVLKHYNSGPSTYRMWLAALALIASFAEVAACERALKLVSVVVRPCASTPCMPATADATAAAFCSAKLLSMALTSANNLACV